MGAGSIRRLRGPAREAHARRALSRFQASGASKVEFCRREGISPVTLSRWQGEFGPAPLPGGSGGFVEVRLDRAASTTGFEVHLASGHRRRIPSGFPSGDLERLLTILARATC